jgi:regulator of sirC expression with transglutaminase-like and TPR domain
VLVTQSGDHTRLNRRLLLATLAGALVPAQISVAQTNTLIDRLRAILATTDYLQAKLAIDAIINPQIDSAATSHAVDRITTAARELAGSNADDARKLASIRTAIYHPGAWNDNRPFAYDMRDPLGRNIQNKLLATYVRTRLGNCVSMPILFLVIADRLGLNVSLATAPEHVFVRYTAQDGRAVNLETTSGGHPARDVWYREHMPMTDAAIANGIYMRTLSRRESIAVMAHTVGEFLMEAGRYAEVIDVAEAINQHSPRDVGSILLGAAAYGRMFADEFENRYPSLESIPPSLHARYRELATMNASLYAHAEELGWRPVTD